MDYIQKAKPWKNLVGLKVLERIDAALQFQKDFLHISSGLAERTEPATAGYSTRITH
jgi:hypothetical protein